MNVVTGALDISESTSPTPAGLGRAVRTITHAPDKPNPFGDKVQALPYNFAQPDRLTESLARGGCAL